MLRTHKPHVVVLEVCAQVLQLRMGIAWELRTPGTCRCGPYYFKTLEERKNGGRVACTSCRARYTYETTRLSTTITRENPRS